MPIDPARLRAVFLEEFEEHLGTLQRELLALERDPATVGERLPELFRAAHSLKGSAQAVRLPAIAAACHRLEDQLASVRSGATELDADVLARLIGEVDALAAAGAELDVAERGEDGQPATPGPLPAVSATATRTATPSEREAARRPPLRIPAARLDDLVDRAGDVLVARDRLTRMAREARELADTASTVDQAWRDVRVRLRETVDADDESAVTEVDQAWHRTLLRIDQLRSDAADGARLLHEAAVGLERGTRQLRLQPFRHACEGLERAVRDLLQASDPEQRATVTIEGADAEIDAEVVLALRDPLLHLVRNAIAHGIEPVEERRRAGKDETGTVTVAARVLGDQVQVRVVDDGAGLDLDALRAGAAERGLDVEDADTAVARLAWLPGLSTARTPDPLAGRGVGLDAVRSRVEQLGGSVQLQSTTGQGCTVTLHLPVTLTTLHALIVEVAGQQLALPSAAVQRIVRLPSDAVVHSPGSSPQVPVDGGLARVLSLRAFLGHGPATASEHLLAVVVTDVSGPAALLVDGFVAARRISRRPLHPRLDGAPGVLGTTALPTGEAALVLNPFASVQDQPDVVLSREVAVAEVHRPRVLLAEDSATTRALEQDILEGAGYDVLVAVDGSEAWRLLLERGADVVVTDVEMPGMDGFALCSAIRDHGELGDVPVVLLTSRGSDEDRHRGLEAGANAYLVKGAFDQDTFLATIGRLL